MYRLNSKTHLKSLLVSCVIYTKAQSFERNQDALPAGSRPPTINTARKEKPLCAIFDRQFYSILFVWNLQKRHKNL